MRILREDPESDYEPDEADDRTYADCIGDGDSLEEQLGKLVWSTIQFDVPPLHTFGMLDTWNDQRFLRHRKLQRKMSCASTMEDTLKKADVVLSFLNVAAGKDEETKSTRPKVFDKPGIVAQFITLSNFILFCPSSIENYETGRADSGQAVE